MSQPQLTETHSHLHLAKIVPAPRDAPIAAMLCSEPLMDGPHRLTRRQALRLGAGAAALGALRLPSPALAAGAAPALFELALPDARAHAASAAWRATDVLQAPHRFDLAGLRWTPRRALRGPDPHPHLRRPLDALDAAAEEPRHARRHRPRLHGRRRRAPAAHARQRPRPQGPLRQDAPRRRRPAARAAQAGDGPPIVPRANWGADQVPPRWRAELRHRPGGVRAPHGHRGRLRAGGIGRDRPRHRPLPPRLQRLERHRLQLPRRPLRGRSSRAARAASKRP